jgi:hypothetical protein
MQGFGVGIPIVTLITMGVQAGKLKKGEPADYDIGKFAVGASKLSVWKTILAVAIGFTLLWATVYLRTLEYAEPQKSAKAPAKAPAISAEADAKFRALREQAEQTEKASQQAQQAQRQAEALIEAAAKRGAAARVRVMSSNFDCQFSCVNYKLTVKIQNDSSYPVSSFGLGWVFLPEKDSECPTTIKARRQDNIALPPGGSTVLNLDGYDGPSGRFHYCIQVSNVVFLLFPPEL